MRRPLTRRLLPWSSAPAGMTQETRTFYPTGSGIPCDKPFALLVSRSGDPFTVAPDRVDDLVGGLRPLKRLGVLVPELDPLFERAGQLVDRAEDATVEPTALQFSEPPLDLVQPRGIRRGEVQLEPRGLQQPPLDRRGLVHGAVVADQADCQAGLDGVVDPVGEAL